MATYPAGIYAPRAKANKAGVVYDASKTTQIFAEDITKEDDEVVALETELGLLPKGTSASVAERLKGIRSLSDANADVLVVKAGNVGIGMTNPGFKLDVGSGQAAFPSGSATVPGIVGRVAGNTGLYWTDDGIGALLHVATNGVNVATFGRTGNVGIGTTEPSGKLHMDGGQLSLTGGSNTDNVNGLMLWGNISGGTIYARGNVSGGDDVLNLIGYDGLNLMTGAGNTKVTIQNNGNVGIGTTIPTAKLDINSDILRLRIAKTPASAGAAGNAGDICWDANFIYVCVDTNTWKKVAIATW